MVTFLHLTISASSLPHWTPWHVALGSEWATRILAPPCSPRWSTWHFPVNEFNGLGSDSNELPLWWLGPGHALLLPTGASQTWALGLLLYSSLNNSRSGLTVFVFALCVVFFPHSPPIFFFSSWYFCARKRNQVPTNTAKKTRQFAPHYSKLSKA